jgi:hypothetical protein
MPNSCFFHSALVLPQYHSCAGKIIVPETSPISTGHVTRLFRLLRAIRQSCWETDNLPTGKDIAGFLPTVFMETTDLLIQPGVCALCWLL